MSFAVPVIAYEDGNAAKGHRWMFEEIGTTV